MLKQEPKNINKHLIIKLEFPISKASVVLSNVLKVNDDNLLENIQEHKQVILTTGYYMKFTDSFNVEILLKRDEFLIKEDSDSENEEEQLFIAVLNNTQTFQTDLCVACMEYIPNVLFCECGHISLCESCIDVSIEKYKCPVCKHPNTIRRVLKTLKYNK